MSRQQRCSNNTVDSDNAIAGSTLDFWFWLQKGNKRHVPQHHATHQHKHQPAVSI
jgi:hypothetical protein